MNTEAQKSSNSKGKIIFQTSIFWGSMLNFAGGYSDSLKTFPAEPPLGYIPSHEARRRRLLHIWGFLKPPCCNQHRFRACPGLKGKRWISFYLDNFSRGPGKWVTQLFWDLLGLWDHISNTYPTYGTYGSCDFLLPTSAALPCLAKSF